MTWSSSPAIGLAAFLAASVVGRSAGAEEDSFQPEPSRYGEVRLGGGLGPIGLLETTSKVDTEDQPRSFDYHGGGLVSASLALGLGREHDMTVEGLVSLAHGGSGTVLPVGGRLAFRHDFHPIFFAGVAVMLGIVQTPEPPRDQPGQFEPQSSFYVAPELVPAGLRLGDGFEITVRTGLLFADQADVETARFAPAYFSHALWAGYRFELVPGD